MPVAVAKPSFKALAALEDEVNQHEQAANAKRQKLAKMLQDMAQSFGIKPQAIAAASAKSPEKLTAKTVKRGKAKQVVPVKYRNPENYAETWSGRGRPARWLAAKMAKGAKVEDFRVSA